MIAGPRQDAASAEGCRLHEHPTTRPDVCTGRKLNEWLIFLLVLVAFFEVLALTLIAAPLNQVLSRVTAYIPRITGASLLVFIAAPAWPKRCWGRNSVFSMPGADGPSQGRF